MISSAKSIKKIIADIAKSAKKIIADTEEPAKDIASKTYKTGTEAVISGAKSVGDSAKRVYLNLKYSREQIKKDEDNIKYQGRYYRELIKKNRINAGMCVDEGTQVSLFRSDTNDEPFKNRRPLDLIFLGGESLAVQVADTDLHPDIVDAYEAAYPSLVNEGITLQEGLQNLDESGIQGFVSGIKGKLFEKKYRDYLNDGNLPEGYEAHIPDSPNQPGWNIQIEGPNNEIVSQLQAKATNSVSYVTDALKTHPEIDVVTTEEVYSYLVLTGVSESLVNSDMSNEDLSSFIEAEVGDTASSIDFAPPVVTLAFIAFTSYRDENLTLYQKAQTFGDRSGKAYLAYLVGGGAAAVTNTWWLGPLATIASRYLADEGLRKLKLVNQLSKIYKKNQDIIKKMEGRLGSSSPA